MTQPLIIQAPRQGIGPSPHVGFGDMRNLDIYSIPGIVRLNNLLAKKSSTTVTGLIKWFKINPQSTGQVFALDDAGQLYKSTDNGDTWATVTGETAGGAGQGMEIMNGYVIVARATSLDVYNIAGNSWTNSWKTIDSDTLWHPMIRSRNDGKIYGGAGKYVFSIEELTTFDPSSAPTFTFTQQALDLPADYRIKCLAELGNNLMCGTWKGTNIYDLKVADIFPWDRSSPSFLNPVELNKNGVNAMITIDNSLFIQAGIDGELFESNGVQAWTIGQVPSSVASLEGGLYLEPFPGALIDYKGKLFFGVSGSAAIPGMGVWSLLKTSRGNIINFEHTISTGNDGTSNVMKIGALLGISRDTLVVGWRDNATYGIDKTTNTLRTTSYGGYFESAFFSVGTNLEKAQYTQGEFQLARPLASGQGIKVKYRTDMSASYTTIGTYDFATLGAVLSHNFTPDIPACEFVQVRVELTTGASNTTPEFKNIIFR